MALCLVLQFYVRFLCYCCGSLALGCSLSPMKSMRDFVAYGALYRVFGGGDVGDGGGTFL